MRRAFCVGILAVLACARGAQEGAPAVGGQVPAVQGLVASAAADALRVDLSWQPAGPGFSYTVVRSDPTPSTLAVVGGTSYAVTALSPGEQACFAVQARDNQRTGPLSPSVCAVALDVPRPPAPVTAFGIAGGVRIVWSAAREGAVATEWILEIEGSERVLPASTLAMEVTGLTAGTRYQFSVAGKNAAGRSRASTASAIAGGPSSLPPLWTPGPRVPVFAAGATVALGRLWVAGNDGNSGNRLVSARLGGDGLPMAWEDSGLTGFASAAVYTGWMKGGAAFLIGTGNICCGVGTEPTGRVVAFELHQDGSAAVVGPQAPVGPVPSVRPGLATDGAHLFSVGGFWWSGGSFTGYGTGLPFVYVADVGEGGRIAAWRRSTPLPRAATQAQAAFLAGRVYVLLQDRSGVSLAVQAQPAADGSIGEWRTTDGPGATTNALIAAGGYLYAVGAEEGALFVGSPGPQGNLSWSTSRAEALGRPAVPPVFAGAEEHLYLLRFESSGTSTVAVANIDPSTGHVSKTPGDQPAAPASVSAVSTAPGSVILTWDAVAGADSYEVRKVGDASSTPTTATQATIAGLDPLASVRFEVRAVSGAIGGRWMASDAIFPWPSSTWRPSLSLGQDRAYAFLAGNTIFAVAYHPFSAPLDARGLPWSAIGIERYVSSPSAHHTNEAGASVPISDSAACLVLSGGRDYQDEPPGNRVSIGCAEDDGFQGRSLDAPVADPMPAGRVDHAAAAVGPRIYLLGGLGNGSGGAVTALADVSFATLGPDLSVKGWTRTTPLPGAAATLGATGAGGRVYAVAPSFAPDRVLVADVTADGSLGAWRESGRMPYPRTAPSAIVVRNFLYVLGGGSEGSPTTLIARLDPGTGTTSGWTADPADSFVGQRTNPSVLARGATLYVFGNAGSAGTSALQTAEIDPETGHFKRWR